MRYGRFAELWVCHAGESRLTQQSHVGAAYTVPVLTLALLLWSHIKYARTRLWRKHRKQSKPYRRSTNERPVWGEKRFWPALCCTRHHLPRQPALEPEAQNAYARQSVSRAIWSITLLQCFSHVFRLNRRTFWREAEFVPRHSGDKATVVVRFPHALGKNGAKEIRVTNPFWGTHIATKHKHNY